jgi:glutamine synthetase
VKVAVSDIDGILRGKYLHRDKFFSAVDSGFGFCDVVFGWDMHDQCYDNTQLTGWHHGFPDAMVRLDLATHRNVPWDGDVDFFLGNFVTPEGKPHPLCPRQTLKRVLARARRWASARWSAPSSSSSTSARRRTPGRRRRASRPRRSRPACSATRCCART